MRKQGPRLSLALGRKPGVPRRQGLTITERKWPRVTTHAGGRDSREVGQQRCRPSKPVFSAIDKSLLVVYTLKFGKNQDINEST